MKFSRQNNVNHISATQVVTQIVVFDPDTFVNGCVFSTHLRLSTPVCAIDGSMKKVYKKYFVENQTSKASIKLISGRKKENMHMRCFFLVSIQT